MGGLWGGGRSGNILQGKKGTSGNTLQGKETSTRRLIDHCVIRKLVTSVYCLEDILEGAFKMGAKGRGFQPSKDEMEFSRKAID